MKHSDFYESLKFNISFMRRKQGLSQAQLAEKVGISRTHMSNIEAPNGKSLPSLDVLVDIANALNTTPSKLIEMKN